MSLLDTPLIPEYERPRVDGRARSESKMGELQQLTAERELLSSEQIGKASAEFEQVLIDDLDDGDSLSAARGVVLGMVLGSICWAVILAVIFWAVL